MTGPIILDAFKQTKVEKVPNAKTQRQNIARTDKENEEDLIKKVEAARNADNDEVREAIKRIVDMANFFNRKIHVEIDRDLEITIAKVIDSETEEVIRQIPPEEMVELSRKAKDMKGLLINTIS